MQQITFEEFVTRAQEKFGTKYRYAFETWVGSLTEVMVTCPEHGDFKQVAKNHLKGAGCPKCRAPARKLTQAQFLARCAEIHGDYYDYGRVEYSGMSNAVTIVCRKHGPFQQSPAVHLSRGQTCTKCPDCYKMWNAKRCAHTLEQFIDKAKDIHGDRYDYSLAQYKNSLSKLTIICKTHGAFDQQAGNHLTGSGCPKCADQENGHRHRKSLAQFIEQAKATHNNVYDYSLVSYVNYGSPVAIVCPSHGVFQQRPADHIDGHKCPECSKEQMTGAPALPFATFQVRANLIHNARYCYSPDHYSTVRDDVGIICPEHGLFFQRGYNHLNGTGCPMCKVSSPQRMVMDFLDQLGIEYRTNDRSGVLGNGKGGRALEADIWIPAHRLAIEVSGTYWHSSAASQDRDWIVNHQYRKHENALKQGIRLLHYYDDEVLNKFPIVSSSLRHALGVLSDSWYARQTRLREVGWIEASSFYHKHHLQGPSRPAPTLGLYREGELVAAMSIGRPVSDRHARRANSVELIRYATKGRIVGGASKLLQAFVRQTNPSLVFSFSDRRISDGRLYQTLGFQCVKTLSPDYVYVDKGVRKHKSHFTRARLAARFDNFDPAMTEEANCHNNRIYKLYNCGLQRWELSLR